jgi:transposase-like protein
MKHRTRKERVFNEATGWYETREVELKSYLFTDDDRISIVREYLESGIPAEKIIKKYHISSRSVLFSWMDRFLNAKDSLPLQQEPQIEEDMAKTKDERLKEKDAEIKRLRKALELEKLRSNAYSTMIDLAEQTFNIPVRKKSGTKQ